MKKRGEMNKGAKSFFSAAFVFGITFSVLFFASFVLADFAEYATLSSGTISSRNFSIIDEDVYVVLNFSVNSSQTTAGGYITAVNVTLPYPLTFGSSGNGTNAGYGVGNLTTSAATMNWSNGTVSDPGLSGLLNGSGTTSTRYFYINVSSAAPGRYNISVKIDGTERFLDVNVNDSTAPFSVSFLPASGAFNVGGATNISNSTLYINITANDTHGTINTFNISLINSSGLVHSNATYNFSLSTVYNKVLGILNGTAGANGTGSVNWFGLPDGTYTLNVSVNDSSNNRFTTSLTQKIQVDTVSPAVAPTLSSSDRSSITANVGGSDATSGIETCTVSGGNNPVLTGTTSFTDTELTCSNTYTYIVTCTDYAGNQGTSGGTDFTTSSCSGGSNNGGGGGTTWTKTYSENDQELSLKGSVTQELSANHRIRLMVSGETHHVGVKSISGGKATIEVASTPQEKELAAGESGKFDVTGDGTYDLLVTVQTIEGSKANVRVEYIQEEVTEETQGSGTEDGQEEGGLLGGLGNNEGTGLSNGAWIAIVIAIVIIIALVVFFVRRNK
ncbi:hypothetical protein AUJ64_01590 [Candidatus Pacearchaeota archaeon CG1_02_39_14]|nr:MAG: hypothetical protein AUJ64_01590 [Candidatus Pacearchaeota archaeon CG1_02_39_14]